MNHIYEFVSGPLVWVAVTVFLVGSIVRIVSMISAARNKDIQVVEYMSLRYALRSILHWSVPFMSTNMRLRPVMTIVTFFFHLCLFITPLFLLAHVVMFDQAFSLSWATLPDQLADAMTLVVIAACLYFLGRRLTLAEAQYVTSASDYVILTMVAAPFVTGFLAYHQIFNYPLMLVLHIVTGEIMLMAIPFTRLSHMFYAPFTRAYIGSEFGAVRHARDW